MVCRGALQWEGILFVLCKIIQTAMIIICNVKFLSFYFHWFCSTDIAVYFVGLTFKRQHNESAYGKSVTFTLTVFIKRTIAWELYF